MAGSSINVLLNVKIMQMALTVTEICYTPSSERQLCYGALWEINSCAASCTVREQSQQEQQHLKQECVHISSRLDATQSECQREREVRGNRQRRDLMCEKKGGR